MWSFFHYFFANWMVLFLNTLCSDSVTWGLGHWGGMAILSWFQCLFCVLNRTKSFANIPRNIGLGAIDQANEALIPFLNIMQLAWQKIVVIWIRGGSDSHNWGRMGSNYPLNHRSTFYPKSTVLPQKVSQQDGIINVSCQKNN